MGNYHVQFCSLGLVGFVITIKLEGYLCFILRLISFNSYRGSNVCIKVYFCML